MRYQFGGYVLDSDAHRLTCDGVAVPVEPQVFDLLQLLAENAGQLVSRDQIVDVVWNGRIVSESAISARIAAARKAVGDDGKSQAVIRTVARRGLQMVAPVTTDTAPAHAASDDTLRIRYATSDEGKSLAYVITGQGPPVLRVGSLMTDIELEWHVAIERPLFDKVGTHHSLLRYDPIGAGQSDTELEQVDFEVMADDLRAIADAAGIDRAVLWSETGGTLPAIHFAAKYPERVSRFVCVGGYVEGRSRRAPTAEPDALRAMMAEGWSTQDSSFVKAYVMAYFPEATAGDLNEMSHLVQAARSKQSMLKIRDASNDASVAHLLARIKCPTLVIHGRNDGVHPLSQGRKLAAGIENAELVVLETANNMPLPNSPVWEQYVETLLAFMGEEERSGVGA